jgi:NADH dehydrogenase FAD-containing subunit
MLAASAVGTVETSSITESIKQANPHVLYVQGSVRAVDAESRSITIETASSLSARGEAATETVELDYTTLVSAANMCKHIATSGSNATCCYCSTCSETANTVIMLCTSTRQYFGTVVYLLAVESGCIVVRVFML